ncbi:hypothetical protein SAMN04488515_2249 [Cognatiyoonia koreensis]|uniref:Uncharacterized protein n=1 Tax=Cognatiyoonia koreensis TaxID=364200 RepID=A0A1I0QVW2_9RHOB|nr:hypothetical protein [Cognatiyoonia koreensis]SEW31723.1 hypothetical protein SAMN04488515_2249 [Cognatiyoonia koreensis]
MLALSFLPLLVLLFLITTTGAVGVVFLISFNVGSAGAILYGATSTSSIDYQQVNQ